MTLAVPLGHAASITDQLGGTAATRAIARSLGRAAVGAVPVTAVSPGLVYEWSDQLMSWDPSLFGQVLIERPETIGRGNAYLSAIYRWIALDSLDGQDLATLRDVRLPICQIGRGRCRPGRAPFTISAFHVDARMNQVEMSATYGPLDDLETSLTLPVVASDFHGRLTLHEAVRPRTIVDRAPHAEPAGVGDLLLRGKYRLARLGSLATAAGLMLRIPTGDADDLQGTGSVGVSPMVYAAADRIGVIPHVVLRPYFNAGIDLDAGDVSQSEVRWGLGLDAQPDDRLVLAVGFLARHAFEPFGPPGELDATRCVGTLAGCTRAQAPVRETVMPLFGIESGARDYYDLSLGMRALLFGKVMATLNVILPLNDQGVRTAPIPVLGIELPFVSPSRTEALDEP